MKILELLQKVRFILILDETLEVIFFHFNENLAKVKIDFEIFARLFFLFMKKAEIESDESKNNENVNMPQNDIEENYNEEDMSSFEEKKENCSDKLKYGAESDFFD